jgi:hypothetical protein
LEKKKKAGQVGKRFEYRVRDYFRRAGLLSERVPLSGVSSILKGDLLIASEDGEQWFLEVKKRNTGYRELEDWLDKIKEEGLMGIVLGIRRKTPVVIMDIDTFIELFKKRREKHGESDVVLLDKGQREDGGKES